MAYTAYPWVSEALFPRLRRLRLETDNTLPSRVQVKKEYSYISTPPVRLRDVHRDKIDHLLADVI